MGVEVVDHGRRFAGRVDQGLTQLETLTAYLKVVVMVVVVVVVVVVTTISS
jgi:hypothetical protein